MRNFAKLQKSAKLQKNADSKNMHIKCINSQRNKYFYQQAQHKAQQRNKKCCATDFKGFFRRNRRNTTASVVAQHQPPHPPLGGWGLLRPSRCGFYSHSVLMQCLRQQNINDADFRQNRKIWQKQCGV
ncbi:hypothetical protein [Salmonella enterica]|uniref:hypothetical protein n=2 Tax=Salmonella enterica TaxID=28901 RepID=UPI0009AE2C15|nr:hypothetical protein [Salmonella enterica]